MKRKQKQTKERLAIIDGVHVDVFGGDITDEELHKVMQHVSEMKPTPDDEEARRKLRGDPTKSPKK